jgi:hypothetical protein
MRTLEAVTKFFKTLYFFKDLLICKKKNNKTIIK